MERCWAARPVHAAAAEPAAPEPGRPAPPSMPGSDPPRVQEHHVDQSRARRPKSRTTFRPEQLRLLRASFAQSRYITAERGSQLARELGLSYKQVKTWFQNQRLKVKRSQKAPPYALQPQDHRLCQLEPDTGPQGLSHPSLFQVDPMDDCPEDYAGPVDQVSENWLQNYGEGPSPYQVALQAPYATGALEAPVGPMGWGYPMGSPAPVASCAPPLMQGHLQPLPTGMPGGSVQLEQGCSVGSETGFASASTPDIGSALPDQTYPLMGPGLFGP
ncbi:uncharacterized protein LOC141522939 [Macrotis lagotis]|uniref:uncharacterized protein LOC141522939 n=1 Tax=Macrotis lagotis TaxID=92651 RepID=UPI003D69AC1E